MLKLGDKTINKLALGDKVINKAYLGNKLVYETGGRYVSSILFDGASYIDTGIPHQNCRVECDIRFDGNGIRQLMGFGDATGQYWGCATNGIFDGIGGTNATVRTNVILDFVIESDTKTKLIISGIGKTITWNGTRVSNKTYTIGALGYTSKKYYLTGEIWRNKVYIDNELIQDLRPYVTNDGVACFKDVITGQIPPKNGAGTLSYTE